MPNVSGSYHSPELQNLALLVRLRWLAISGQALAILITHFVLKIPMPLVNMLAILSFLAGINLVAHERSKRRVQIGGSLLTLEIMVDVLALTLLLYLSGGATNPFTSLFILQDIIAIVLLPPLAAGLVIGSTMLAGLALLRFGRPLNLPHRAAAGPGFDDLFLVGTYLSFVICALLSAWFIMGIRANLNRRDAELARAQSQIDAEAAILRMGLLASTAAHDLGTPLTNLAVILDDWADLGLPAPEETRRQIELMQEAVQTCRASISGMLQAAGAARLDEAAPQDVASFVAQVVARWQSGRVTVEIADQRSRPCRIVADVLLSKALGNLLDNSAEAGADAIRIEIVNAGLRVQIAVCDNGPGFPAGLLATGPALFQSGNPVPSLGPSRGLGLFLVQSVLRRMDGDLRLSNLESGGARAALYLPYIG